jgi:DNA modification methylase
VKLYLADCRLFLATLPECSVDACICDPPYGLGFMGKSWDRFDVPGGINRGGNGPKAGATGRAHSHGLAGNDAVAFQEWCRGWAAQVLRVLKPGGYLLAFGGTRTYHRMACGVEDAGFSVRDCLAWMYGTGFPKSTRLTRFTTLEGLGTALKPAFEPVVLAQRAMEGGVAENVTRWGTGALDIDGCRIGTSKRVPWSPSGPRIGQRCKGDEGQRSPGESGRDPHIGRWPANVVLDEEAAAVLDEQSGTLKSGAWDGKRTSPKTKNTFGEFGGAPEAPRTGDSGGASRFFYVAKVSPSERGEGNEHPTVKPIALMRWLCRLACPAGGVVLDPFMGSGSTGIAAVQEGMDFIGVEQDKTYFETAKRRVGAAWQEAH